MSRSYIPCNNRTFFHKENDQKNMCYNESTIEEGYYFKNNLYKQCNYRCSTCNQGGNDELSNCEKCNNAKNYHFSPYISNHCINESELNTNSYFYVDKSQDKFKVCHSTCLRCNGPNNNNCILCDNTNYFSVEFFENRCLSRSQAAWLQYARR